MENQNSLSFPKELGYRIWIVKRNDPIEITIHEYEGLVRVLEAGKTFAKIRHFVIMINSISLIEPMPRPKAEYKTEFDTEGPKQIQVNKKLIDSWDSYFK